MPYGIDTDAFEYVTDAQGRRMKALVPVTTLNALIEFWCAARRAQSDAHETREKPHLRPAPLRVMMPGLDESPALPHKHDQHWQKLIEKLPDTSPHFLTDRPAEAPPAEVPEGNLKKTRRQRKSAQTFFARDFTEAIPDEVAALIRQGTYFIRAWRLYRRLTVEDVADLQGASRGAAGYHEFGYDRPTERILKRYAEAFDCTLGQLTVKPGTNTAPWLMVIEKTAAPVTSITEPEQRASEDTDYPEAVLAHLIDGKSPLTAWRLFRRLTLRQLGEAYGTQSFNVQRMETRTELKLRTREKFAVILGCTPVQLLRPEGLEDREPRPERSESPASRRITQAMLASAR